MLRVMLFAYLMGRATEWIYTRVSRRRGNTDTTPEEPMRSKDYDELRFRLQAENQLRVAPVNYTGERIKFSVPEMPVEQALDAMLVLMGHPTEAANCS